MKTGFDQKSMQLHTTCKETNMRVAEWVHPNKMRFESGHKTFDNYVTCISRGNVIGPGQLSTHVRAWNTPTNPLGTPCKPGDMQRFDLQHWRLPRDVADYIGKVAVDQDVYLYEFYHYNPSRVLTRRSMMRGPTVERIRERRIVHGHIITRAADHLLLHKFVSGPSYKSWQVINEAATYVSELC